MGEYQVVYMCNWNPRGKYKRLKEIMAKLFQLWLKIINSETKECHPLPSWVNIESITIRHIKIKLQISNGEEKWKNKWHKSHWQTNVTADFSLEFMQVRRYLNGLLLYWGERETGGKREKEGRRLRKVGRERERENSKPQLKYL